jgi:hypothetical protein
MWIVQHCVVPPPLIFPEMAVVPGTAPVGPGPASLTYQYTASDTSSDSSYQEAFSYIELINFISILPQRKFFSSRFEIELHEFARKAENLGTFLFEALQKS